MGLLADLSPGRIYENLPESAFLLKKNREVVGCRCTIRFVYEHPNTNKLLQKVRNWRVKEESAVLALCGENGCRQVTRLSEGVFVRIRVIHFSGDAHTMMELLVLLSICEPTDSRKIKINKKGFPAAQRPTRR